MVFLKKQIKLLILHFDIFGEFISFLWKNNLWWGIPIIFAILIIMIILIFGQGTGLAPFIYPLF
ncbi:MAG: DUF5989 family protein [Candidatus Levybacteria bacterium]|nr:DUF5989 family protein [Candidatus Levybacteria bacterium]